MAEPKDMEKSAQSANKTVSDLAVGPNGDVKSGVYQISKGTFTVMHREEPGYEKNMEEGLRHKNRDKYYKRLTPDEKKLVDQANEQGKGVRWKDEQGNHIFTFVPKEEQKQKAAAKEAQQAEEEKKGGFWSRNGWLKWALGGLALVGAGIGAYFLLKKDKKKSPEPKTPAQTEQKDPTPTTTGGQEVPGPAIINPGDELGNGPGGMNVSGGLTVNPGVGGGLDPGVVSGGLTAPTIGEPHLTSRLGTLGSAVNVGSEPQVTSGLTIGCDNSI